MCEGRFQVQVPQGPLDEIYHSPVATTNRSQTGSIQTTIWYKLRRILCREHRRVTLEVNRAIQITPLKLRADFQEILKLEQGCT